MKGFGNIQLLPLPSQDVHGHNSKLRNRSELRPKRNIEIFCAGALVVAKTTAKFGGTCTQIADANSCSSHCQGHDRGSSSCLVPPQICNCRSKFHEYLQLLGQGRITMSCSSYQSGRLRAEPPLYGAGGP